jgi:7 transmembrane receptor (rhodopsin family).
MEAISLIATRAAFDLIIVFFIVFSNAFIVLAILRYRRRRRRVEHSALSSASVRFALNLSISDLLVGLSTIYYLSSKYLCSLVAALSHLKYLCLFMFVMIVCAHATSAYTIVAIAIDRYIAVVYALRYREFMSTR